MIITELITIGTTPDVRTNPNGHRTMYFRGACERPMSEGTEWLSIYISDPPLIERVNKLNLDKGDRIVATGSLRLETHRDGTPNPVLSCGGFELVPKRRTESPTAEAPSPNTESPTTEAQSPPRSARKKPAEEPNHDPFADSQMAYVEQESEASDPADIFAGM